MQILLQVPELYKFFSSSHIEYHFEHREFLLQMLASGIKEVRDYRIADRSYTSKLIIGLLPSPTASIGLKVY